MRLVLLPLCLARVCAAQCITQEFQPLELGSRYALSVVADGPWLAIGNPNVPSDGQVEMFKEVDRHWDFAGVVRPSDPHTGSSFGAASDMDGDRLVVGDPTHAGTVPRAGAAYVFTRVGDAWVQTAKLDRPAPVEGDIFGSSVAVSGHILVVGADGVDSTAEDAGAAYIYEYDGDVWNRRAELVPPGPWRRGDFGKAVATDGTRVAVGARRGGLGFGAVVVYGRVGGEWLVEAVLQPSLVGIDDSEFGKSLAIRGSRLLVGAPLDDERESFDGAVHVYEHGGTGWTLVQKLHTALPVSGGLGEAVALSGDLIVASAPYDAGPDHRGSIRVFEFDGSKWAQSANIPRTGVAVPDSSFGLAMAETNGYVAVGAPEATIVLPGGLWIIAGLGYMIDLIRCQCPADLDRDGELTFFDFLEFQNLFAAQDPRADFDGDGALTLFDFLAFQNEFAAGCS